MTDFRFGRRRLLLAAAASTASLPLLRALEGAAGAADPGLKNFICLYHPHGMTAEFWAMKRTDSRDGLRPRVRQLLAPAVRRRRDLRQELQGQDPRSSKGIDHLSNANGHDSAGTILTGSRIDGNAKPRQLVARSVPRGRARASARARRVTSVALGVGIDVTESGSRSRSARAAPRCPRSSIRCRPSTSLFANLAVPNDPAARAAAERKRKVGQSVLDFVRGDSATCAPARRRRAAEARPAPDVAARDRKAAAADRHAAPAPLALPADRARRQQVPEAQAVQRRRAVLRRHHRRAHRPAGQRHGLRRHALRHAVHERPQLRRAIRSGCPPTTTATSRTPTTPRRIGNNGRPGRGQSRHLGAARQVQRTATRRSRG